MGNYVIFDSTTNEVVSIVKDKFSADIMVANGYSKAHWDLDISGELPRISSKRNKKQLTGTFTFANDNSNVSVDGGDLSNELSVGQYILFVPDNKVVKVQAIPDADNITLSANYSGTGGVGDCILLPDYSEFVDTRGYKEKRRTAYEMELDRMVECWRGQKDLDGVAETTSLTGTITLTSGQTTLTGNGTSFLSELPVGSYLHLDADGVSIKVESISNDTTGVLSETYMGTGGAGAGSKVMLEKGMVDEKRREIKNLYPSS